LLANFRNIERKHKKMSDAGSKGTSDATRREVLGSIWLDMVLLLLLHAVWEKEVCLARSKTACNEAFSFVFVVKRFKKPTKSWTAARSIRLTNGNASSGASILTGNCRV
jgi:hypothetical protein